MAVGEGRRNLTHRISEHGKRSCASDRRVQLPKAACSGVSRVSEYPVSRLFLTRVEGGKFGLAHVNLAAHL